jgi:hypothetical protein
MRDYDSDIENLRKIWNKFKIDDESMIKRMLLEIKEEIHKPDDEMDCDLIDENVITILYLHGQDEEVNVNAEEELRKAYRRANSVMPNLRKILRKMRRCFWR